MASDCRFSKRRSGMASSSKVTTNHDEIRKWAEERGGKPVRVRGTGDKEDGGVLRIDFPGAAGEERLEPLSWDQWFKEFDARNLAFVHQDRKADGELSTFFKLVREDEAAGPKKERERGR
jgi:hypothetical protein